MRYDFICNSCNKIKELFFSMKDISDAKPECEICSVIMSRVWNNPPQANVVKTVGSLLDKNTRPKEWFHQHNIALQKENAKIQRQTLIEQ